MTFEEAMATNPARLVILHRVNGGADQFQWGIVGEVSVLTIIGAIACAQARLMTGDFMVKECPEQAFVIAVTADGQIHYFVSHKIPVEALIGMLETIKAAMVGSRLAQHAASQQMVQAKTPILGPDGAPIKR